MTNDITATLLSRLEKVHQVSSDKWEALCPAHADKDPSLSIRKTDDRILLNCLAGCEFEDILEALSLKPKDLFFNRNGNKPYKAESRQIVATYDYTDKAGNLLFQVVRYEPKDFRQRRPDGNGGWLWNLKGTEPVLYDLPEVLQAIQSSETVYLTEGEKDADNLKVLGLTATTNAMGAGKWRDSYSTILEGAKVVILSDKDEPGRKHAQQVAESLQGKAASMKVIELPGKGKDPSDWISQGGTSEELEKLVNDIPDWHPKAAKPNKDGWTCADLLKVEFPPPAWVVPDLLPVGLAILAGRPKLGKSRLALQLAVAVGSGGVWLDRHIEKGNVLAFLLEDSPRRIQDRLVKMRVPQDTAIRFHFGLEAPLNTNEGLNGLWSIVDEVKPRLVILDTMARCFNGRVDWNDVAAVTAGLSAIQASAMERNISILFVDHHRKGSGELRDAVTDIVSSVSKPGIADTIMGFYRSPGKREWTLAIIGRDVEEQELTLNFDGLIACWHVNRQDL